MWQLLIFDLAFKNAAQTGKILFLPIKQVMEVMVQKYKVNESIMLFSKLSTL